MKSVPCSVLIASWGSLLSVALFAIALVFSSDLPYRNQSGSRLQLGSLMGNESSQTGFIKAKEGVSLVFPRDHASHSGFQNEWWYLTGNLRDKNDPQRLFGFQFTLFRFALAPLNNSSTEKSDNPWLEPQFYMAHFAITHANDGEHRAGERFSRQGPGLAGARWMRTKEGNTAEPFLKLWLANWLMQSHGQDDLFPMTIAAADSDQEIGLTLEAIATKPMVLQGNRGVSLKNFEGGASFYYSYPRLSVDGQLQWQGQQYAVEGLAWFDHEWSSNSLADYQLGWDWFSLQLDDGRDLMYYRFRNRDGSEGLSHFNLIDTTGRSLAIEADAVELSPLGQWLSPEGAAYPSGWQLRVPAQELNLEIQPLVKDQLMDLSVRYWEGAVKVTGSHQGRGYVELSGYE